MLHAASIDDISALSATASTLELILQNWVSDLADLCGGPDVLTLSDAINYLARLTAIRKSLIRISRGQLDPDPIPSSNASHFSPPSPPSPSSPFTSPDREPVLSEVQSLREIQDVHCLPQLDLSQISPALSSFSSDLRDRIAERYFIDPPLASATEPDVSVGRFGSKRHLIRGQNVLQMPMAVSPDASSAAQDTPVVAAAVDPRCVELNIHPGCDTTLYPEGHPLFDRSLYGSALSVRARKHKRRAD